VTRPSLLRRHERAQSDKLIRPVGTCPEAFVRVDGRVKPVLDQTRKFLARKLTL
jgi:hypothetical protein